MSTKPEPEKTPEELTRQFSELASEVRRLRELLEHLRLQQYVRAVLNTRRIAGISFLSGVMSGLGAVIGATLVLTLLVYILSRLEVVPHLGHFISQILDIIQQQQHKH